MFPALRAVVFFPLSSRMSWVSSSTLVLASSMFPALRAVVFSHQHAYLSYTFCSALPSASILAFSSLISSTTLSTGLAALASANKAKRQTILITLFFDVGKDRPLRNREGESSSTTNHFSRL